ELLQSPTPITLNQRYEARRIEPKRDPEYAFVKTQRTWRAAPLLVYHDGAYAGGVGQDSPSKSRSAACPHLMKILTAGPAQTACTRPMRQAMNPEEAEPLLNDF